MVKIIYTKFKNDYKYHHLKYKNASFKITINSYSELNSVRLLHLNYLEYQL